MTGSHHHRDRTDAAADPSRLAGVGGAGSAVGSGADAVERVSADELAYYMAGALTDSEHAALTRRIEKDPEASGLLARMNAVDDLYRAVFPPPGPEPDPHEPMPRAVAARLNARIAQLALARENAMNPDGARRTRLAPLAPPTAAGGANALGDENAAPEDA